MALGPGKLKDQIQNKLGLKQDNEREFKPVTFA
mgnify:CR=1 FL=1